MPAPDTVKLLIETFQNNSVFYNSDQYNEYQLRQEFIDPFCRALGWDMDNEAGLAPQYRDVIHEASIKIGKSTKAPDYAFSIHGQYKFFLEAKKPAVNIQDCADPAYQLRRYGWSAKLPISILTNFEEFAIYDCRKRPKRGEKPSTSRLDYFRYTDYIEKWDELCTTFSKEAILKGSFDKYTVDTKIHRGTETVDDAFLEEIEYWRSLLARNFAIRNSSLNVRDLNFAVQKTIDRLIFLRICEDRGTEDYKRLSTLLDGGHIYTRLLEQFMTADARYNSGLFHFSAEKGRGVPDKITPKLTLDDKVLKEIISKLYYPESPYEFSVLPADILGQVYEQFLGKTIRLTSGHQAKVEEKPEVRKAGGVYYTPTYIVNYIVKNTLGRLLDGSDPEKPKPIAISKAAKIKVLDPACGSGSFLIVAYQYLLDWHLRQYTADPITNEPEQGKIKRHSGGNKPKIYISPNGAWRLTTDERKRILLNNIFGVDIDNQAVEVTKLSLLLKVVEGEAQQIRQRNWIRERQRILPDLDQNIKCGNSLIGPDFYDDDRMLLLDEETQFHINTFDWKQGFPEMCQSGGFDCIIGNPPWGALFLDDELEYLRKRYRTIIVRMIDSFMYFISASMEKLCNDGLLGMIVPDVLLYQIDNEKLRKHIFATSKLHIAINAGNVFQKVTRPSAIIILENGASEQKDIMVSDLTLVAMKDKERIFEKGLTYEFADLCLIKGLPNTAIPTQHVGNYTLVSKILGSNHPPLSAFVDDDGIQRGISPDLKEAFIVPLSTARKLMLESTFLRPVVTGGRQVKRYGCKYDNLQIIYTTRSTNPHLCPNICNYIKTFKNQITCREVSEGKHPIYALHRPRSESIFTKSEKLIGVITEDEIVLHLDSSQLYASDGLYLFGAKGIHTNRYLIGLLNSTLFVFLYRNLAVEKGRVLAQVKPSLLANLPIRPIDFGKADDIAKYDKMILLVDRMLELNRKRAGESNPETLGFLETQIVNTDRQIDRLVYDLYDLTPGEILLIENLSGH
jgi:type I restriction-modification system DNA methylase subunit